MTSFADFFWAMIVFYFLFMVIWIFIRIFADIFHRRDLTGGWKAIWILVLFIVPFFGAIVYMITRPVTAQDLEDKAAFEQQQAAMLAAQQAQVAAQTASDTTAADQITKLVALRDSGAITQAEFDAAKAKALA
jgi:Short C-terminal domain/Phospholipase_D-nuclease N-terminal